MIFPVLNSYKKIVADFPVTHPPFATSGSDPLPSLSKQPLRCTADFLLAAVNDQSDEGKKWQQVRMTSANQGEVRVMDLFQFAKK